MAQVSLGDGRIVEMPAVSLKDYVKPEVRKVTRLMMPVRTTAFWKIRIGSSPKFYRKFEKEKKKVKPMVDKVSEKLNLDQYASEALLDVVATMRSATSAKDKLAAAKLVLDFTMAKPAAKQDIKVSSAEDWLKSIAGNE